VSHQIHWANSHREIKPPLATIIDPKHDMERRHKQTAFKDMVGFVWHPNLHIKCDAFIQIEIEYSANGAATE
jgi:hypothetical protein